MLVGKGDFIKTVMLCEPFYMSAQVVVDMDISDCAADSLTYPLFLQELDNLGRIYSTNKEGLAGPPTVKVYHISSKILGRIRQGNYCSFLFYVAGFNQLLNRGLDLEFDHSKHIPIYRSSLVLGDGKDTVFTGGDSVHIQQQLYQNFLMLKGNYEKYIVATFLAADNRDVFYIEIDNVIKYGAYHFPNTLRKILRSEFAHLTKEKFREDIDKAHLRLIGND